MERMGPKGGDPVTLNLLISGYDRGEVDYIRSQIMGFELNEVKHLNYYLELNKTDTDKIEIVGENINDVKHTSVKAQINDCVPPNFIVHNSNACSACGNALLLSCQLLHETTKNEADIFMGDVTSLSGSENKLNVGLGNCSRKNHLPYDASIGGCPPYPFALKKLFESATRE